MWLFLTVCGFVQVACQGFLVKKACVCVLVGGAEFLLSPFEDLGCFTGFLMSSAGIQKLFCGIYSAFKCSFDEFVGEKVFSPSYSSAILAPPPNAIILNEMTYHFNTSDEISRSVVSDSLQPHELQHAMPPCRTPTPRVHPDSRPSSQ